MTTMGRKFSVFPLLLAFLVVGCSGEPKSGTPRPDGDHQRLAGQSATASGGEASKGESAKNSVPQPPRVLSVSYRPAGFYRGVDLTVMPELAEGDVDRVQFRYLWIVNGEERSWIDAAVLPGEEFHRGDRIAIEVTPFLDGVAGEAFRSREITVPNAPPLFVSAPEAVLSGAAYSYQARAEDADGDALTYALEAAPAGATIDSQTGDIRWQLGPGDAGEHRFVVTVTDAGGGQNSQEFTLNLSPPN